jgi:hypothetical protein
MEFPKVPHSHVVPAGYLRAWAHDGRIAMRLAGRNEPVLIGVRDAAVRTDFYKRDRPGTGETIYDIEWSLAQGERAALPVVANLAERWPLELDDKGKVGQFFALQHLRGPAFRAWHETRVQHEVARLRDDPARHTTPPPGMTPHDAVEHVAEAATSATFRLTRMLSLVRSVGILFSSMHWTLVRFPRGRLVTSDHPVVVWPASRGRARPQPNDLNAGLANTLEVFAPVGPDLLLLMTWLPERDSPHIIDARGRHLSTANAFVAANAEVQWFHEPGASPWLAKGPRQPLSHDLIPGYDAAVAARSPTRHQAWALAQAETKAPLSNDPVSVVAVGADA